MLRRLVSPWPFDLDVNNAGAMCPWGLNVDSCPSAIEIGFRNRATVESSLYLPPRGKYEAYFKGVVYIVL